MFLKFNPLYGNGLLFDEVESVGGNSTETETHESPQNETETKGETETHESHPKEDADVQTKAGNDDSHVENKGNSFEGGKSQGMSSVKEDNTEVSQKSETDNAKAKNESFAEKAIESTKEVMENVEKSHSKNESLSEIATVAKDHAESAMSVSEHIDKSQPKNEDTSFTTGVSKTDQGNTANRNTGRKADGSSNHSPHEGSDRDYKVGDKPNNGSRDTQPQTVPNYPDVKPNANPHIVNKNGKVLDLDKLGIDPSAEIHVFQKGQNDQAQALANKSRSGTIRELHTLDDGSTVVSIRNIGGGAPKPKNIEDAGVVSHHKNDNGKTLNQGNTSNQFESKITNSGKTSVSKEDAGVVSHNKNYNGKTANHGKK